MANQYITIREHDLGGGIDNESAENNIPQSFSEDLVNINAESSGELIVRTGYEGYLGYVPLRVNRIEYLDTLTDNICLFLDGSVDLTSVDLSRTTSTPLILLGKTSKQNLSNVGDFKTDFTNIKYYPGFTTQIKKTFFSGINTIEIPQTEHGGSSPYLDVYFTESVDFTNNNNSLIFPDTVRIDSFTNTVYLTYNNQTGADIPGFVYIRDRIAVSGQSYVSSIITVPDGGDTIVIPAATHNLSNFNILPTVFEVIGTDIYKAIPDSLTISSVGTVTINISNDTGVDREILVSLAAAPILNSVTNSLAGNSSTTVSIPALGFDFISYSIYLEDINTGLLEQIYADNVDVINQEANFSFTNNNTEGANFQIFYEGALVATNKLCITGTQIDTVDMFTDTHPQLTLYGLPHKEVYGTERKPRQGWVNHIDNYKSDLTEKVIAGLGGNLFSAELNTSSQIQDQYLMPTLYPDIRGRVAVDTVIGPVFYDTNEEPPRTRGTITGTTAGNNFIQITAVEYNTITGHTDYQLNLPNLSVNGILSTIISTVEGSEDLLTVQQMGHSRLNGTFKIKDIAVNGTEILVSVENPRITDGCYNEEDAGGRAGVFSDRVTLLNPSRFLPKDIVSSELFINYSCLGSVDSVVLLSDISQSINLPGGLRLVAERHTSVLPLKNLAGTRTVENLVRGDMLEVSGLARKVRVQSIRTEADTDITITGDGLLATVTLLSGNTLSLALGTKLNILRGGVFSGQITVSSILSATEFTFDSVIIGTVFGVLQGQTVQIDEEMLVTDSLQSTINYKLMGRWVPIEGPETTNTLPDSTNISYFKTKGYTDQEIIRSTVVKNNMYFTNYTDSVMKYDGQSLYRAGLFRWQPHLYGTIDTDNPGKIVVPSNPITYDSASGAKYTFSSNPENIESFSVGQEIIDNKNNTKYTITKIETLITAGVPVGFVFVDKAIDTSGSGSLTLTRVFVFKYYFRLNAVDINNNTVASAVTGVDDFNISITEDSAIRIRMVGMPIWDIYDYNTLELEVYRTKSNEATTFYRVTTLPLDFNPTTGYIDYTDTASDFDLFDFDNVNSALLGAELGTTWSEPVRAKYISTANNRLVLGNIRDYPTLDLRLVQNNTGPITITELVKTANRNYLFRKDNQDTGTVTNMIDRAEYVFTNQAVAIPPMSITNNSDTSFTVTVTNTLQPGDWVYLFHNTPNSKLSLTYAGHWQVVSATSSEFTVNYNQLTGYTPADEVNRVCFSPISRAIPVFLGTDLNYSMDNGNRLSGQPYEFVAVRRLANAINSSMRQTDINLVPDFKPWMIGNAGNEFNSGQLIVKQPLANSLFLEIVLPAFNTDFTVFVNNIKREPNSQAGARELVFPSRVLISYSNYPEIFDAPTATLDIESESAIDVNSADGQQITGIIPFFGDSAFGGANQSAIIVIFKENSIYLADISAKVEGTNAIQKIESQNKGCTYPYSISVTKDGIMFANFAGIYKLKKDLNITYVGQKIKRLWDKVNKSTSILTGHHYANENQYKLSVPFQDSEENSEVLVYDHTREYAQQSDRGSWTRYTNHPVTGWVNQTINAYFGTTTGEVFKVRNTGEDSDFRDDNQPISWKILLRAMDFGDASIRKIFSVVISHFRTIKTNKNIQLKAAVNLSKNLVKTDSFTVDKPTPNTLLSDIEGGKVTSIRSSLPERTGLFLQLEYSGKELDTPMELAGVDLRISGRNTKGTLQAKNSNKN
jgi:hypothetical protein